MSADALSNYTVGKRSTPLPSAPRERVDVFGFLRSMVSRLMSLIPFLSTKVESVPSAKKNLKPIRSYTLTMSMVDMYGGSYVDIATLDLWDDSRITISHNGWLTTCELHPLSKPLGEGW